jgi:hypothetical protein
MTNERRIPIKENSKAIEAISYAFKRSLEDLGIEPVRFHAIPPQQRKLAIREAIYNITGQKITEIDFLLDRSDFQSKQLGDFSPEQIRQHKTVIDALIAMVCLGDTTFIRPLITYLSFPEPRWPIFIEPVLRAVLKKSIHGPIYRLPTEEERFKWRIWALKQITKTTLEDYSPILLSQIGDEEIRWDHFSSSDSSDSSWLVLKDDIFKPKSKYYNYSDANFCTYNLFPSLKNHNFTVFVKLLDNFIKENPNKTNYDTISACIKDTISELDLSSKSLKNNYLNVIDDKELSPMTFVVLFWGLDFTKNRILANKLSRKIAGEDSNHFIITTMSDIFTKSENINAIHRYAKVFKNFDEFSDNNRDALFELAPIIYVNLIRWIVYIFTSEIESISILGCENPLKRKNLFPHITMQFEFNNKSLMKLIEIKKSLNSNCQEFGCKILELYEDRQEFKKSFLDNDEITTTLLTLEYQKMINSWLSEFTELKPFFVEKLDNPSKDVK